MHIVFVIANNSSVPYFKWFAEKATEAKNYRFTFVALHSEIPEMINDVKKFGWKCYWIKFNNTKRKSNMIKAFFSLYKLFKEIKPDVVHSHLFDDSLPTLFAARLAGIKKRVITKQDTTFHYYYAKKWMIADKFNNWNATHIHAVATENMKFIIEKEKALEQKVHLVRNGFRYDLMTKNNNLYVDELKLQYNLANKTVVGTVARLIPWKGHNLIIKAAKKLIKIYPNLLFVWAGSDGGDGFKDELQELINHEGLQDNIIILGWIERYKMPSLYNCMDIYLHPALREPFGFAITEALMNSVPIIATKTGSTDLIENFKEGILIEENSIDDIVNAIVYYLENKSETKNISTKGNQHAIDNLTFNKMWEGHINMYNN